MLIIPIENRPDWANPPWLTTLLIIINLAVFLSCQSADDKLAEQASSYYLQENLVVRERYLVEQYLRVNYPDIVAQLSTVTGSQDYYISLSAIAFGLPEIDEVIRRFWQTAEIDTSQWRADRAQFERYREQLSSYEYGLVAANPRWYSYVTYAFLHGSWGHILGNMIFLFIFGFVLEVVLGRLTYMVGYGLTAVLSGLAYQWMNSDSPVPLVGASGAISALMGAYIIFYGLRKIRFFYSLGFYFGELKTYALAILPLWLIKEIYGYFYLQDQVAQSAHLGGLLAGAGCMLLWQRAFPQQKKVVERPDVHEVDTRVSEHLSIISSYIDELALDKAIVACQRYLREDPAHVELLRLYFHTAQMRPKSKAFQQITFDILKTLTRQQQPDHDLVCLAREIVDAYRAHSPHGPVLSHDALLARLSVWLLRNNAPGLAVDLLDAYLNKASVNPSLKQSLTLAVEYFRKTRDDKNAQRYAELLRRVDSASVSP